ncbi:peptidoglycan-associated lipoprotein [Sideroxyarcus emersonii]|uniref:Peptidoglycan-associated lipoprotein n=1 Tax=Sideroxyarcus emersonii TaxID=2764705 RepID=A0AAN1XAL9_9PROT|nr:peptidoglycan-associated lipoprotein Pal [Sideroxyarcus emersonii]BCK88002.1 peptidoglycan-associated lipoprotein [Sideroxyarcus emersonii]
MKKIAVVLAALLIAACSSTQKADTTQAAQTSNKADNTKTVSLSAAEVAANKLAAEQQALQQDSVYFDFDKYAVKPDYQNAIQKQADFIKEHKNDVVTLEGNADERGSEKYNLALGSKRANAVKHRLLSLGVPAGQIRMVSYGKTKPRLQCHEEKCWKENRRVDFAHKLN